MSYFSSSRPSVTGNLNGSVGEFTGTITLGVDRRGIYLGTTSAITAREIRLTGNVQATTNIGVLDNVKLAGQASFSGRVNVSFADSDKDGKLRCIESQGAFFRKDAWRNGEIRERC